MSSAFLIAPRCPNCAFLKAIVSRLGSVRGAMRVKPLVTDEKRIGIVVLIGRSMMKQYTSNACNVWHRAAPLTKCSVNGAPIRRSRGQPHLHWLPLAQEAIERKLIHQLQSHLLEGWRLDR